MDLGKVMIQWNGPKASISEKARVSVCLRDWEYRAWGEITSKCSSSGHQERELGSLFPPKGRLLDTG